MNYRFVSVMVLMATMAKADSQKRESVEIKTNMISTSTVNWDVFSKTILDEDSGIQYLRIKHELTANILASDVVQFELSYIPWSQWKSGTNIAGQPTGIDNTLATTLGEDAARCSLTINASNKKFWTATVNDVWYKCDIPATLPSGWLTGNLANKCAHNANTYVGDAANVESASNNNWSAPVLDNDSEAPWCTQANTEKEYSPYQCKKITCIMQRPLDTNENVFDYQFDFANGQATNPISTEVGNDAMIIQLGRARVWINSDTFSTGMAGPSATDITKQLSGVLSEKGYTSIIVVANSIQLVASSVALVAGIIISIFN